MTDRTEAMDNLIAQDADLIDAQPTQNDGNFHKLPLSESFERVAKVAEERAAFNEQMASKLPVTDIMEQLFAEADNFKVDRDVDMRVMLYRAADRIEQLEREKAVVSDLWEQQKEIALDYLTDCNKAADRIEAQVAEIERLREHLISALDTLKDAEICDDNCGPCNEARAALEQSQ